MPARTDKFAHFSGAATKQWSRQAPLNAAAILQGASQND
jgi:hypothetical protein